MEVIATQKYLITSPKKLREAVSYVKKLTPTRAVEILPHIGKRASTPLSKVIKSAIANAKAKGVNEGDLVFKEIQIGEGPRLKRWQAGAHGRVKPFKKRMSHIRVVLATKSEIQNPTAKQVIHIETSPKKANPKVENEKKGAK